MKFNADFFEENQKNLLGLLNSPIGWAFRRGMWIPDRKHRIVKITPKAYHVVLPNGKCRAEFHTNPQHAQGLHKNYRFIWEALHWWDMRIANRMMPAWNAGFDSYSVQPDGTAGKDTTLRDDTPTTNYGTTTVFNVGEHNASASVQRALLAFDFSSVPAGSIFTSLTQSLYIEADFSSNARTFRCYKILRDWVESEATWNIWKTGNNWTTAGAGSDGNDYANTDIGNCSYTATESVGTEKQYAFLAAGLTYINGIVAGTISNYGWIIRADTETNDMYRHYSSDDATAGTRPKAVGTYDPPSGIVFFM